MSGTLEKVAGGSRVFEPRGRIAEIDLLRFVAAFSVVVYHYCCRGPNGGLTKIAFPEISDVLKYGFLGVHLFFMISGFVILMSINFGGVRQFVASRISRLYPAFWVACSATYVVLHFFGEASFGDWPNYMANMTMFSWVFNVNPIDGVYWSLFVEMRFYFLVLLMLTLRKRVTFEFFIIFWLLVTASYDIFEFSRFRNLFIIDYSPFFIVGAVSYLIYAEGVKKSLVIMAMMSWILMICRVKQISQEYQGLLHVDVHPLVLASMLSAYFLILICVALRKTGWFSKRSWGILGAITYPLYLLHQNIGYRIFDAGILWTNRWILLLSVLLGMLVLSYVVHVQFERRLAPPLRAVLGGNRPSVH